MMMVPAVGLMAASYSKLLCGDGKPYVKKVRLHYVDSWGRGRVGCAVAACRLALCILLLVHTWHLAWHWLAPTQVWDAELPVALRFTADAHALYSHGVDRSCTNRQPPDPPGPPTQR